MKSLRREIKEMPDKDIVDRLEAEILELSQLKINHSITPLDNSGEIKDKRRNIARLNTELRARELNKA